MNGQLNEKPFPELIREVRVSRRSGVLRLSQEKVMKAVFFENGLPVFAISNLKSEQLGELLVRIGKINREDFERASALVKANKGKRLGTILAENGFIDQAEIIPVVRQQVSEIIYSLFEWETGEYIFDEKVRADSDIKLNTFTPEIILEGVRRIKNESLIRAIFNDKGRKVQPAKDPQLRFQGVNLLPAEAFVLSRVDGPLAIEEILAMGGLPENETLRALCGLVSAGIIEYCEPIRDTAQRKTAARTSTNQQSNGNESEAKIREEILRTASFYNNADYYEVLGVTRSATPDEIKKAYYSLAKKFHPDRYHRSLEVDIRSKLETIFAKVSEAYEVLKNSEAREKYDQKIKAKPGATESAPPPPPTVSDSTAQKAASTNAKWKEKIQDNAGQKEKTQPNVPPPRSSQPVPQPQDAKPTVIVTKGQALSPAQQADLTFKRGQVFLQEKNYLEAVQMFRESVRLIPDNVQYRIYLAQSLSKNPKWFKEAEQQLLKASELEPYNASIYIRLGLLYKQAGMPKRAEAKFRDALSIDPTNRIALRELDTNKDEQNQRSDLKSLLKSDIGTIFSKLFKKK